MSDRYPLEIENVGEDICILMSRGHHDPAEFMRRVREMGYDWSLGMPEHRWVKATPTRREDLRCIYTLVKKGTRGAFPATYAWEAYGHERYEERCAANAGARTAQAAGACA